MKKLDYTLISPLFEKTQELSQKYNESLEKNRHITFVEKAFGQSFAISTFLAVEEAKDISLEAIEVLVIILSNAKNKIGHLTNVEQYVVARDIEISFLGELAELKNKGEKNIKPLFLKYFRKIRECGAVFL